MLIGVDKVSSDADSHKGDVTCLVVHNDLLYSAGRDGKIKIWDFELNFVKELHIKGNYIFAIVVDRTGQLYTSSSDATIKVFPKPLESDNHTVIFQHDNEIKAIFVDENLIFYCGDTHGAISSFENGQLRITTNIVEGVKSLFVEKELFYTLMTADLLIHDIKSTGKYLMKASITAKYPVTFFGKKDDGRSKYIAILNRSGTGVMLVLNSIPEKFRTLTVKDFLNEEIIKAMGGFGEYLFTCDEHGAVVKSQVQKDKLKAVGNVHTSPLTPLCTNCVAASDEMFVFVGSVDGSIKRVNFNEKPIPVEPVEEEGQVPVPAKCKFCGK